MSGLYGGSCCNSHPQWHLDRLSGDYVRLRTLGGFWNYSDSSLMCQQGIQTSDPNYNVFFVHLNHKASPFVSYFCVSLISGFFFTEIFLYRAFWYLPKVIWKNLNMAAEHKYILHSYFALDLPCKICLGIRGIQQAAFQSQEVDQEVAPMNQKN